MITNLISNRMEYKKDTPGGLCYKEGTDDALTILGYNGSSGILDLTQIYEGKTITAIAEGAFRGCDNLKKLSFRNPDTILSDIFQANDDWVEKVVINGEPGGSIERFAQENNLRFNRFLKAVSLKTKPTKLDYFYGETLNLASICPGGSFLSSGCLCSLLWRRFEPGLLKMRGRRGLIID